jgi:hypothetical protein
MLEKRGKAMQCDEVWARLAEYIADVMSGKGPGASREAEALERHIEGCAACRAEAERLRWVEEALWSYPGVTPPADLTAAVMRRVAAECPVAQEEWHLLPWDVWVPAVAFVLALLVAVVSIPPGLMPGIPGEGLGGAVASWSEQVNTWLAPAQGPAHGGLVWVVLGAILATTAGLGLSLAVNAFPAAEVSEMESRVSSAASRLWDMARRAH